MTAVNTAHKGKLQKSRERESHERGNRHPDGKRELHPVFAQQSRKPGQKFCDASQDNGPITAM
jgi:hypothetical protein